MADGNAFPGPGDSFDSMTESECRSLLGSRTFGRVGVTSGGLPVILPVRYLYADGAITFRTGGGTKLRAAASGDVLAFEVDSYDTELSSGWSVLVLGRATVLTTEYEEDGLPTIDPPRAGETRSHYVRLHCEMITGRRMVPLSSGLAPGRGRA